MNGLEVEHSERFAYLLQWLADRSPIQATIEELVEQTGVPARSLHRHLRRMEDLSILVVARASEFGRGRLPNRYTVIVHPEEWQKRSAATLEEEKRRRAARAKKDAQMLRTEAAIAAANERAAGEIRAAAEMFANPDPVIIRAEESIQREVELTRRSSSCAKDATS